ncbi:MAG: hypothetical protein K2K22_02500 [Muribaculaceae bacterium]|nr:hypothetical protein [Muribaculaceae bacterium]
MKTIRFLASAFLAIGIISLAACGDDEPEYPDNNYDYPENNEKPDTPQDSNIKNIVSENTSVKCSYSDYLFTFNIRSTVKSELPTRKIAYGIGHPSASYSADESVSVGEQAYYYSISTKNGVDEVTFKIPFWFYFVFSSPDKEKWALCEMYYASYCALINAGLPNLSADEKTLYNELTKELNEYESEARIYYRPNVYVMVDNKFYKVGSFKIP